MTVRFAEPYTIAIKIVRISRVFTLGGLLRCACQTKSKHQVEGPTRKNQTMTENTATQTDSPPIVTPERGENDELMDKLRPYLTQIGIAVILGLLALIAITLFINSRQQSVSAPWQELTAAQSEFAISGNVDRLTQVASQHPDTAAAMQALQTAGDFQLRQGLDQLQTDRDTGFGSIQKAKESYQQMLDAPKSAKTPSLQQSSVFAMAYACESLGEFDDAAKYYTQLIEEAPESHFVADAKRGVARSTNPEFAAAYKKFREYEPLGDAPGPNVPTRPEIDFPEIDFPEIDVPSDEAAPDEVMPEDSETEGEAKMEQPEVKAAPATTDEEAPADPAKLEPAEANPTSSSTETTESTTEVVEPATTEGAAVETVEPSSTETPTVSDVVEVVEEVVTPAAGE